MGMEIVEREGAVLGVNVGHPIITSGDFIAFSAVRDGDTALFQNYFGISCFHLV